MIEYLPYCPLEHARQVVKLWVRSLGDRYPLTERIWFPRLVARASLGPEDGVVAVDGGRLVGFGLLEIDRSALLPASVAAIQALIVDPHCRRCGVGSAVLARLESVAGHEGLTDIHAFGGLNRFWSGVPEDLPAVTAFFARRGYAVNYQSIDLAGPVAGYRMPASCHERMQTEDIAIAGMSHKQCGQVYDFLTREAPHWRGSMLAFVHHGDLGDLLVVSQFDAIVGCIQTYSPRTRYRGANVVWEGRYGHEIGGFGAVIIAKDRRGEGLGALMCQAAAEHIARNGAAACYIDWTSDALAPFYGKVGVQTIGRFNMMAKKLGA